MEFEMDQKLVMFKNPPAENSLWMGFGDSRCYGIDSIGACLGFSVVHAYMAATNKLAWWYQVLQAISQWDGGKGSLADAPLPNNSETLYSLIRRAINYVVHHQAHTFSIHKEWFVSEYGEIQDEYSLACNMENYLEDLLKSSQFQALFNQPIMMLIETTAHACALRFSEQSWYFYDSNNIAGEVQLTLPALIETIKAILKVGDKYHLAIQFSSWEKIQALDSFKQFYATSLTNRFSELMISSELIRPYGYLQLPEVAASALMQHNKTFAEHGMLVELIMEAKKYNMIFAYYNIVSNIPVKNLLIGLYLYFFAHNTKKATIAQNGLTIGAALFDLYAIAIKTSQGYMLNMAQITLGMILGTYLFPLIMCAKLKYSAAHTIYGERKKQGNGESERLLPGDLKVSCGS